MPPRPTVRHRARGGSFCARRVSTYRRPAHLIWFPFLPFERSASTAFQDRRRKPGFGGGSSREGATPREAGVVDRRPVEGIVPDGNGRLEWNDDEITSSWIGQA
jgi:hypothetical protein